MRISEILAELKLEPKQDNFTIDDIKSLEKIRDLETLRARAKELIKGKPQRRMKPEKIAFFYNRVDSLNSPVQIIKLMYDLLLAGEGHKVVGSKNSMNPNSYRQRFGENLEENIFTTDYHKVMDAVAALYDSHYGINIWNNAKGHDEAAKVLMKEHPSADELDFIIDTHELPERFMELDFPLNDDIMYGITSDDDQNVGEGVVDEEPASRSLCQSGKPDSALGASQLSSCKSQGYRSRDGGKSHKVGSERVKVRGKKIKGKKYGGPLPDWS
jgi:hypothetical protein